VDCSSPKGERGIRESNEERVKELEGAPCGDVPVVYSIMGAMIRVWIHACRHLFLSIYLSIYLSILFNSILFYLL
jgi:hypothetical protein